MTATGVLAVPVLRYFCIIDCRFEETQKNRQENWIYANSVQNGLPEGWHSLHVKEKQGGKNLLQTEATHQAEIINIAKYLNTKYKEDEILSRIKSHEHGQPNMNSTSTVAEKLCKN